MLISAQETCLINIIIENGLSAFFQDNSKNRNHWWK